MCGKKIVMWPEMNKKCPRTITGRASGKTRKTYTVLTGAQKIAGPGGHRDLVTEVAGLAQVDVGWMATNTAVFRIRIFVFVYLWTHWFDRCSNGCCPG